MKSLYQAESRRTTIVPRNERFGTFGSDLLLLPSGTLLCSYGRRDFEREVSQQIVVASTDRGRTWCEPRVVDEEPGLNGGFRADSLNLLSDGRIAIVTTPERYWTNPHDVSGFRIKWSTDEGVTWSEPFLAADQGTVPWCNHIVETADGDLVLTTRSPTNVPVVKKRVLQYRSRDRGTTWEGPRVIAEDPILMFTEPSTTRLKDGRLMCVMRDNNYNFFPSYKMFSEDGGETWSKPEEMPIIGHELYLGQLHDGRIMVAYRHVGGYAATLAWVGDPDETGFQVAGGVRAATPPEICDGLLKVRTAGRGESVVYLLHPAEGEKSTIQLEAELRCAANRNNACGIHVGQAGWVTFYPDRVELPECGDVSARIDATEFHRYRIVRDATEMVVSADGRELLRTGQLDRGDVNKHGIRLKNRNAFGTVNWHFMLSLPTDEEVEGEAEWRSVKLSIQNPTHADYEYEWNASSQQLPNRYEDDRMIEIEVEDEFGSNVYFVGQVSWVQFPDGEIFMATGRQYVREDGERSSWLRGCFLCREDLAERT